MSQFLLAKSANLVLLPNGMSLDPIDGNEFLCDVAASVFGSEGGGNVATVSDGATDFDGLFVRAKSEVLSGIPFERTRLHALLVALADSAEIVVLWYGDDYGGLDLVSDKADFLDLVRQGLDSQSTEAYVMYVKRVCRDAGRK